MATQLPQDTSQAALTYLTSLTNTLSSLLTTATTNYTAFILPLLPPPLQSLSRTISSILAPLILTSKSKSAADGTSTAAPTVDIVALASLIIILYLSLRTLDFLRRSIFAWVRFFVRVGVLLLVVQVGLYVQANGWEKSVRDAGWLAGLVWGWAEEMVGGQGTNAYAYGAAGRARGTNGKGWLNTSGGGGRGQMKYGGGGGGTRRRGGWS